MPLLVAACGLQPQGSGDLQVSGGPEVYGAFQIELVPATQDPGQAAILGRLYDGNTPSPVIWEVAATEGGCELLTPRIPFCDPSCPTSDACVEDDECQPYPTPVEVGLVTVWGVETTDGASSFTMEPIAGYYQPPAAVDLAFPPFTEGEVVRFAASGTANTEPFTMTASGIAPLEVGAETVELVDGESIEVQWTQASRPELADIVVSINISYHAGTKGIIRCEAPDEGALVLSGSMLDGLKALGLSGWPVIVYTRVSRGTSEPEVPAELFVESSVSRDVLIPGLTSCNSDLDCPKGQSCLGDFQCG